MKFLRTLFKWSESLTTRVRSVTWVSRRLKRCTCFSAKKHQELSWRSGPYRNTLSSTLLRRSMRPSWRISSITTFILKKRRPKLWWEAYRWCPGRKCRKHSTCSACSTSKSRGLASQERRFASLRSQVKETEHLRQHLCSSLTDRRCASWPIWLVDLHFIWRDTMRKASCSIDTCQYSTTTYSEFARRSCAEQ